ncbi:MAG: hypothetical protein K0R59_3832 [Sphingobacterium sp.]|jgi:hypothetical protein|uniref:hypothetical protein n=1 Tax=Sphingobacterium sp. CZ-UAM TaxID=1933868 RepID=UPI000985E628|nr:hypothetical protein [Sphingobacterium sp. CZ-UAM]MDF2518536.1 hypothetical protein [Sphingobacterium sp.]OOG17541.1 hypothetical protein BWD42_15220 [Sphingobacterium sp. CZ-UAM]
MTFEEFFAKKKIDLKALKAADEPLFEEFRAHYSAMGEKSFDHSKKFWFNKLRKSYHLAEEEVVVVKKTIQTDPVETAPAATDASVTKPAGFKPRFKATAQAEPAEQKEEPKTEPSTAAANSVPGFKPRFKPGITKNTANSSEEPSAPTELPKDAAPETAKPTGFKPRFKPGITKNTTNSSEEPSVPAELPKDEAPETTKQIGFKPRFKPGVTKAADSTVNEDISSPAEASDSSATQAPKPTGFKPRFKAGLTKAASTDSTQEVTPPTEDLNAKQTAAPEASPKPTDSNTVNPTVEPQQENITETDPTTANKPTGFKPRFKAGITKTAGTDDKQTAEPLQSAKSSIEGATTPSAAADNAITANTSSPAEASSSSTTAASKPTGFKPRFKAGVTKTANTDSSLTVVPSAKDTNEAQTGTPAPQASPILTDGDSSNPPIEPQQSNETQPTNKPTGFKPRFKAGLTKIDKKEE